MAIRPPILRAGDTIGIVTLGSPLGAETINARIRTLRDIGFNVILGRYVYSYEGIVAAPAPQRAADLMDMFTNPEVRMILPTRGGTGIQTILPFLNFELIQRNPKIISGYSDVTVLLNSLYQFSNLITLHSIMLINFSLATPPYDYNQFFEATSTLTAPRVIQNPPGMPQISVIEGNVSAPIVGGNITSLVHTLGTPYEIDTRDKILLLEDLNVPTNTLYRYFTQLSMAGKLQDSVGFVMGECTNCPVAYGTSYVDLINQWLVPLGKPLMMNVSTAHGPYKAAIPIGANVNLNTFTNTLTVLEPFVAL